MGGTPYLRAVRDAVGGARVTRYAADVGEGRDKVDDRHPVLSGLVALVAVAAAVGLVLGLGALVVSRALGLSGGDSQAGSGGGATMVVPTPSDTASSGPSGKPGKHHRPGGSDSSSEAADSITLAAAQQSVSPMGHIDLSGTYPGGDGAVLTVQRFESGAWTDFPVSVTVSGGSYSTYIMTGHAGVNRFRMYDGSADEASNEVKVTVG